MKKYDYTLNQWLKIMAYLHKNEGCKIRDISMDLRIEYSQTHFIIKGLVKKKSIKIKKKGRSTCVLLTKKGKEQSIGAEKIMRTL